ncbi:MAG: restriction endonuclease subunit S [Ferrovum myxofaciens]
MSFSCYPKYKDSRVDWIGEVPEGWGVARLGFECETIVPMRDKPEHLGGEIPWIRIEDFNGKFIGDSKSGQGISPETVNAMNLKVLPVGAVLCSCSCSMGTTAIVVKPLVTNQTFIGVVPGKVFLSDYLYFFFQAAGDHLNSIGTGAIQSYLSRDDFRRLRLPCPSFAEQTAIAAFLDRETTKMDALVAEQEKLIAILKEKRQAVISHAVTKGLDPSVPMKDSGVEWLGEVPEGWDAKRFKQVFRERNERSTDGAETLLSVSSYTGVSPRSEIIDEGDHLSRADSLEGYKVCYPNDLVMNIMLAWNRGLAFSNYEGIVSPAYCVFSVVDGSIPRFLNYLVRTDLYTIYFKAFSSGVIDSRLRLYPDIFGSLFCVLPKPQEQTAIASFLDRETAKIDSLTAEAERGIVLLKERRSALISAAVTGKIDVRISLNVQ